MAGFQYSAVEKSMSFNPRPGTYFWSNGYQFGQVEIQDSGSSRSVTLRSMSGSLNLDTFALNGYGQTSFRKGKTIAEGEEVSFSITEKVK